MRGPALLALCLLCTHAFAAGFTAGDMRITLDRGVITGLSGPGGISYAAASDTRGLCALRTLKGDLTPPAGAPATVGALPATLDLMRPAGADGAALQMKLQYDGAARELVVSQSGRAGGGLHGVQWGVAGIPLDYELIIPGYGGIKLDRQAPVSQLQFSYPMGWECQFVIVQGPKSGFWVWADDPASSYKALRVYKRADCWDLAFESQNLAPFAERTEIASVRWRLGLTGPHWQEAAGRYRQWAQRTYRLTTLADQQPAWVKDTRALVICGMELPLLDTLAKTMDPRQTVLYVHSWRRDGYDRNYPDYTALPQLAPFLDRAHALGFHVMLHVNYFGCDPKNEAWEQLKQYQVREPFRNETLWWTWPVRGLKPGEEPDIKFAYINPAAKAWRELFVSRMKELCTKYPVDALHLDQTLCIWNHAGGKVDGLTMVEGALAEHAELRAALPQVALSGEGLNEVSFRGEAFAQRHAWGLSHSEGTWNRSQLALAHPVCSYVLRPYTIVNGYLGMTNPDNGQLYAAWQQAYVNWGIIPTFSHPGTRQLTAPQGFARQLLEEIAFYQRERLDPDLSGSWEADTVLPYRTASGARVTARRGDGWSLVAADGRTVSRTLTGASSFTTDGVVPGWLAYDDKSLFGLDPSAWYPLVPGPRDLQALHVAALPPGLRLGRVVATEELLTLATTDPQGTLWLGELLATGRCGYTLFSGGGEEVAGELSSSDSGASVSSRGRELIQFHPPWKATRKNEQTGVLEAAGTGQVYAVVRLDLPADSKARFRSEVFMDSGAVGEGKTDGVTYVVQATAGGETLSAQVHNATVAPQALELDLSPFAGKAVSLRLTADPGPARQCTFDWARWANARVVLGRQFQGSATLVSPRAYSTVLTPGGEGQVEQVAPNTYRLTGQFPGAFCLTNRPLQEVTVPCDLTKLPFIRSFLSPQGTVLDSPQYAAGAVADCTVAGVTRHGFSTHPPSQGQTRLDFPVRLPVGAKQLRAQVGLREGSRSEGCLFLVEVTGQEVARKLMLPGKWEALAADLSPWAGKPVVLSLITDADVNYSFDWGAWGEVRVE